MIFGSHLTKKFPYYLHLGYHEVCIHAVSQLRIRWWWQDCEDACALAQTSHSFRGNGRESWGAEDAVAPVSFSGIEHASAAENTCVWFCEGVMKDEITVLGEQ